MDLLNALSAQAEFINSRVVIWVLRLVMIGLGLSLTVVDFKRILVYPKAVTLGLLGQLVGQPALAFGLCLLFGPPPAIAMGLVILAACPSGVTSNAYTFASRADVPLCVTLSALTSIITVFTIPFFINLGFRTFDAGGELSASLGSRMLFELGGVTILPLAIGMVIRAWFPAFAQKALEPIRRFVLYLMVAVLLLGIAASYQELMEHFAAAGALVITMNLLSMGLGFGLGKLFRLPTTQIVTLTFEIGVHNLALSYFITYTLLQRAEFAATALLYAVVMPATALAFVNIARRMLSRETGTRAATA
jgi:bile acid:Na+ symporter, BASS family